MLAALSQTNYIKKAYVKCFDKLIVVTLEEAAKLENIVTVIYK